MRKETLRCLRASSASAQKVQLSMMVGILSVLPWPALKPRTGRLLQALVFLGMEGKIHFPPGSLARSPSSQHLQVSWPCSRISAVEATAMEAAPLIFQWFVSISVPLQLQLLIFLSEHFISECSLIRGACVWESSCVQTCF